MRMGLREANQSFSKAIKAVKSGKEVILTERGRPIAVIKSLEPRGDTGAALRRLESEGVLRRGPKSGKPMPAWSAPVPVKGKSIARTISEERGER
jgi:prevent-host-death family protein